MGQEERERTDRQEPQGASRCEECGGDTRENVVRAAIWTDRGLVAIEDIPARVCDRCGEPLFNEAIARTIADLTERGLPPESLAREIVVPVFSLSEVEVPQGPGRPEVPDEPEEQVVESTFTGREPAAEEMEDDQENQEAFSCQTCGSETDAEVVRSAFWGAEGLVAVEDMPARVCRGCGERFYDDETTWKIHALAEHGSAAHEVRREILVPVFSLSEIEIPQEE